MQIMCLCANYAKLCANKKGATILPHNSLINMSGRQDLNFATYRPQTCYQAALRPELIFRSLSCIGRTPN